MKESEVKLRRNMCISEFCIIQEGHPIMLVTPKEHKIIIATTGRFSSVTDDVWYSVLRIDIVSNNSDRMVSCRTDITCQHQWQSTC